MLVAEQLMVPNVASLEFIPFDTKFFVVYSVLPSDVPVLWDLNVIVAVSPLIGIVPIIKRKETTKSNLTK